MTFILPNASRRHIPPPFFVHGDLHCAVGAWH